MAGTLTFARELPLAAAPAAAWRALAALATVRGSAGGYAGSATVVDLDDDERVATLRLVGAAGSATVAATVAVTVLDGELRVTAEVAPGLGGAPLDEPAAIEALGRLATTLAFALATAERPRRTWDTAVPPTPTPTPTPTAWDAPSPPTPRPRRAPISTTATLRPAPAPPAPPAPHAHERRWITAGVAAAAGLAALRILRERR